MGEEQEPHISTETGTDPSIDSQVLIEHEGPNVGTIAASETSEGIKAHWYSAEKTPAIEGLPVIGATAEDLYRTNAAEGDNPMSPRSIEINAERYGEDTMVTEVSNRAKELARQQFPLASERLIDQFAEKAASKFKSELEAKHTETVAEHDRGVQGLINSLDSPETPLSKVLPNIPAADVRPSLAA